MSEVSSWRQIHHIHKYDENSQHLAFYWWTYIYITAGHLGLEIDMCDCTQRSNCSSSVVCYLCYAVALNKMRDVNPRSRDMAVLPRGHCSHGLVESYLCVEISIVSSATITIQWTNTLVWLPICTQDYFWARLLLKHTNSNSQSWSKSCASSLI